MSAAIADLEAHRPALTGHCYRMLGSAMDADDAVQETMIRAWKGLDHFDGRASLRTWLYRIATNVCLDELAGRARRARPMEEGPAGTIEDAASVLPRTHWLEPIADVRALPADANPAERAVLRETIRLAFVAALQHLPPKQRAALLLTEVLGWSAAETAETLDTSLASVNSALQRARATLAARDVGKAAPISESQSALLNKYVEAFEHYDVDRLTSLLCADARFCMPPYALWLQGRASVHKWLLGPGAACRGSRLVSTAACGSPAFAQYRPSPNGGYHAWALVVLELAGDAIAGWNSFLDVEALLPRFDLPMELPG
ncbi:MAG TPA: sigma-70 family RNA polymerase sigma factor [Bryobacteraceae bacterium]|jgi:RNA polymerase sigma-70 factor (ECF subfamily)|nr:sigma-70 family RNA polymerase sigma factor [Bryobacteraceae bacterium]